MGKPVAVLMMESKVQRALIRLEKDFIPGMKLTFIARHPENPEMTLLVTADDFAGIRSAVDKMEADHGR